MRDHSQAELTTFGRGNHRIELELDLDRVGLFRDAKQTRQPQHVSVYWQPWLAKRDRAHDVGRLATDTSECHQILHGLGNLSPVMINKLTRTFDDALSLVPEQPKRTDQNLNFFWVGNRQRLCVREAGKQAWSHLVDTNIGGLSRQDRRDQKLKRVFVS